MFMKAPECQGNGGFQSPVLKGDGGLKAYLKCNLLAQSGYTMRCVNAMFPTELPSALLIMMV